MALPLTSAISTNPRTSVVALFWLDQRVTINSFENKKPFTPSRVKLQYYLSVRPKEKTKSDPNYGPNVWKRYLPYRKTVYTCDDHLQMGNALASGAPVLILAALYNRH